MLLQDGNVVGSFFDRNTPEGENRFTHLRRAADEWAFISHMLALETDGVTQEDLDYATSLRDNMILAWNSWVLRELEAARFMVLRSHVLDEPATRDGVFYAPGEKVLLGFSCERVLAVVSSYPETIRVPGEGDILLYERKVVEVHCVLAEPRNNEFRVLPVSLVPKVKVLQGDDAN